MLIEDIKYSGRKINAHAILSYFLKSFNTLTFESEEIIYEITNNKIFKMKRPEIISRYELSENFKYNLINNNIEKEETFYIPIALKYNKKNVDKYKLDTNSLLTLYIEDDTKYYFETNEKEITESIKEDMITFLSLLKLYN
jgi:hypothetical protein